MRSRLLLLALVLAGVSPAPASASAAGPLFDAPRTLAADGAGPVVAIGPGGDAVVAWAGRRSGVFVARRGVLGGAFGAPQRISDDIAVRVRISRNLRGALAVAWSGRTDVRVPAALRVAVAPPGAGFGAVESVPLPVGSGVYDNPATGPADNSTVAVLMGGDGSVTAAVTDFERRVLAAVRPPGGRFEEARVLGAEAEGDPVLVADALGATSLLWLTVPGIAAATGPVRQVVMAAERRPGFGFGPPTPISDPGSSAGSPRATANARGDVLAAWAVFDTAVDGGQYFPAGVDVSERQRGGPWTPAQRITTPGGVFSGTPNPALNGRGDGVVASHAFFGRVDTATRPAGRPFGPQRRTVVPGGDGGGAPQDAVGMDASGATVHAFRTGGFGASRILALVGDAAGGARPVTVSDAVEPAGAPDVATDPFGNGLVVWDGGGAIKAATYSAAPPVVTGLRVGRREFRFRVSEPSIVALSVRRSDRRKATQVALATPAANRIRFSGRMRRLLSRRGRYTVTVRSRDAGPVTGRVKVRIRRRP